jgi:catechol 2,3-dioxygenase-like lactoylglutathione lyase family enzyme
MTPSRPPLLGIRHVALFVRELEAATRFWVDVLGYEVEWHPDPDNIYLRGGSDNLALHRAGADAPAAGRLDHLGLAVPRPEDVDSWATHLEAHGVTLHARPKTHRDGSRSLYFHGPEGLLIQVIHHAPLTVAGSIDEAAVID